ncbi:MAG: hypothetical protein E7462_03595 [Ruminococcaceae bacterium]|nr:hypothetical protein [Oscillospiraceae bacterium]
MKCGRKLGQSQSFCDECLEKMKKRPVASNAVVNLPNRPTVKTTTKKRSFRRRYLWDAEDQIGTLRSKVRWLTFLLILAFLGLLVCGGLIVLLLRSQGQIDIPLPSIPGV